MATRIIRSIPPVPGTATVTPTGGERFNEILNAEGPNAARLLAEPTIPVQPQSAVTPPVVQRVETIVTGLREGFKTLDPWVKGQPGHKIASDFLLPKPLRILEIHDGVKAFQNGDVLTGSGKISGYLAGWESIVQNHVAGNHEAAAEGYLAPGAVGYMKNAEEVAGWAKKAGDHIASPAPGQ